MTDLPLHQQEIPLASEKFKVFNYLNDSHLDSLLGECNWHIQLDTLRDGTETVIAGKGTDDVIRNLKKSKSQILEDNGKQFWKQIKCQPWIDFVCQKVNSVPSYCIYEEGSYYRAHFDHAQNGHFSHTLFLNHPDEYEGGELQLLVDGEIKEFKCLPGQVLTYETGLPHQVKEVTKGERKVIIWWTHTNIPDMTDLYAWRTLMKLVRDLAKTDPDVETPFYPRSKEDITDNLIDFVRKPHCIYAQAANNIIRKHLYYNQGHTGI